MDNKIENIKIKLLKHDYLDRELDQFIDISKSLKGEYWTRENYLLELPLKWEYSLVAEKSGKVVGFIIASEKQNLVHIHKFMVMEGYRSCKIGANLLLRLSNLCLVNNIKTIQLKVSMNNTLAIEFYERHSFIRIETDKDMYICSAETSSVYENIKSNLELIKKEVL